MNIYPYKASFLQRDSADLGFCLEQLEVERANLVGWSNGGATALCLAAHESYKSRVEKLVVWGCKQAITEYDRKLCESMRHESAWSPEMKASFEAVYGLVINFINKKARSLVTSSTDCEMNGSMLCSLTWTIVIRVWNDMTMTSDNHYENTCHVIRQDNDNKFSKKFPTRQ